jgi:hypothetical protein
MMGRSRETIRKKTSDCQLWYNIGRSHGIVPGRHFRLAGISLFTPIIPTLVMAAAQALFAAQQ